MVSASHPARAGRCPCNLTRLLLALVLALGVAIPPPAHAQESRPREDSARKLYDEANADYALGHYEEALKKFEAAFHAKQVPALLFNIAQCYRQMRNFEQAAIIYRSFLRLAPTNSAVPLAKQLLKQVEETIASQNHSQRVGPTGTAVAKIPDDTQLSPPAVAPTKVAEVKSNTEELAPPVVSAKVVAPPPPRPLTQAPSAAVKDKVIAAATTPAPPRVKAAPDSPTPAVKRSSPAPAARVDLAEKKPAGPPPEQRRLWTWVAAGTSVAALAAGGFFGMQAKSTDASITGSQHTRAQVDGLQTDLQGQASKANLFLGVGVGLAAVTAALFVLHF